MTHAAAFFKRRSLVLLAAVISVTVLCIAVVDRPLATSIQKHWFNTPLFVLADDFLQIIRIAAAVIVAFFVLFAVLAIFQPQLRVRCLVYCAAPAAGFVALLVTELLKLLFGRTQVYPNYVVQHNYTFRPLAGGEMYMAFPSATAAITASVLAVLWRRVERARIACALLAVAILAAVLITNGHWLSDIIAGVYVGWLVGIWVDSTARARRRDREFAP